MIIRSQDGGGHSFRTNVLSISTASALACTAHPQAKEQNAGKEISITRVVTAHCHREQSFHEHALPSDIDQFGPTLNSPKSRIGGIPSRHAASNSTRQDNCASLNDRWPQPASYAVDGYPRDRIFQNILIASAANLEAGAMTKTHVMQ